MKYVEIVRALVRPLLALSGWATFLYIITKTGAVPTELLGVVATLTGFYFAERAAKKT